MPAQKTRDERPIPHVSARAYNCFFVAQRCN